MMTLWMESGGLDASLCCKFVMNFTNGGVTVPNVRGSARALVESVLKNSPAIDSADSLFFRSNI